MEVRRWRKKDERKRAAATHCFSQSATNSLSPANLYEASYESKNTLERCDSNVSIISLEIRLSDELLLDLEDEWLEEVRPACRQLLTPKEESDDVIPDPLCS